MPDQRWPKLSLLGFSLYACAIAATILIFSVNTEAMGEILNEESSLIMAVEFSDGLLVSNGITMYHTGPKWLVPLGELSDALNISIQVSASQQLAQGFIVDERRTIYLDVKNCKLIKAGTEIPYQCSKSVINADDIYLDSDLLNVLLDSQLSFDIHKSLLVITGKSPFPSQLKAARDIKPTGGNAVRGNQVPRTFEPIKMENNGFAGPSIDQQLSLTTQRLAGQSSTDFQHDTFLASEIFGSDANLFVSGTDKALSETSLNIAKKEPGGGLLGFMNAREVQLVDFSLPTIPLLLDGGRATGVLISSYPLNSTNNFTQREFRGPLPAGWDVELYQNDSLIGRVVSTDSKEYVFSDVPLYYGLNRFSLVFYGPQGQRKEQVETVNVDPSSLPPGESSYRVVEGRRKNSVRDLTIAQFSTSLSPHASASTAYYRSAPSEAESSDVRNYGMLGAVGSFQRFLVGAHVAANDGPINGSAQQLSIQAPFENFNLGISQELFQNFKSDQVRTQSGFNLTGLTRVRGTGSLPIFKGARASFEATHRTYQELSPDWQGVQRLSFATGRAQWFHTLTYDDALTPRLSGQLANLLRIGDIDTRSSVDYKLRITGLDFLMQYYFSKSQVFGLSLAHTVDPVKTDYSFTWTNKFKEFAVSAEVAASTTDEFKALVLLSYGSVFDPRSDSFVFSNQPRTPSGSLAVFSYLDLNQNGKWDPGENGISKIRVQVNGNDIDGETDDNGNLLVSNIPVYQEIGVSLSLRSLADPSYRPLKKGYRLIVRPGHASKIEIPIGIFSEVSGTLVKRANGAPARVRSVELELLRQTALDNTSDGQVIQTTRTESDGFYAFSDVPPGSYMVRIKPFYLETKGLKSHPKTSLVEIPETGFDGQSLDFILY